MTAESEFTPRSISVLLSIFISALNSSLFVANAAVAVFMGGISDDLGWGRGQIGGAASMLFLGMALGAPFFGRFVDRVGPRKIMLPLTACAGTVMASLSLMSHSLPLFYAGHFLLGLCTPSAVATSKMISMWFFRRRGIALTTLSIGVFCCQVAIPPVAQFLMHAVGWKYAYLVFGAIELLICWPFLFLFFREPQSRISDGSASRGAPMDMEGGPPIGTRKALSTGIFWMIVGTQATAVFAQMGMVTHAVGILASHGVTSNLAIWGLSAFSAGGLVAQATTGLLLDRFDTPRVIAPFSVLAFLGMVLLQLSIGNQTVIPAFILVGIGIGGQTNVASYFITRYFGIGGFSGIYGSMLPILLLCAAPAPALVGAVVDLTGNYEWALMGMTALFVVAALLFLSLAPYTYPAGKREKTPDAAPDTTVTV